MGWRALRHPNVLRLLGVTVTENRFVMVSEWMARGSINEFVKADIGADRLELVCFYLFIYSFKVLVLVTDDQMIATA